MCSPLARIDDGDLARDLMHPRSKVPKTYSIKVRGNPDDQALARMHEKGTDCARAAVEMVNLLRAVEE